LVRRLTHRLQRAAPMFSGEAVFQFRLRLICAEIGLFLPAIGLLADIDDGTDSDVPALRPAAVAIVCI